LEKRGVGKETERREKLSVFFEFKNFPTATSLKGGWWGFSLGKKKLSSKKKTRTRDPKHDRKSEELDTHAGGGKKIGA
jgi:hypothetical protein